MPVGKYVSSGAQRHQRFLFWFYTQALRSLQVQYVLSSGSFQITWDIFDSIAYMHIDMYLMYAWYVISNDVIQRAMMFLYKGYASTQIRYGLHRGALWTLPGPLWGPQRALWLYQFCSRSLWDLFSHVHVHSEMNTGFCGFHVGYCELCAWHYALLTGTVWPQSRCTLFYTGDSVSHWCITGAIQRDMSSAHHL